MALKLNPVVWFEIPTADLDRAKSFYEYVLEAATERQDMGNFKMVWLPSESGASGSSGALVHAESYVPSHAGSLVYLAVDDIEATLKRVKEKGGQVLNEKQSIGEYGFVGHFQDSEGNRIGLHADT